MVVMTPLCASTRRMRWLKVSEKKRLPALSNATSNGPFSNAALAGPPSPAKPFSPVPTAVVITYSAIADPPCAIQIERYAIFHHRGTEGTEANRLPVIASKAKQSPADRASSEEDCFVAALLAMTALFGARASRPQCGPEARGPVSLCGLYVSVVILCSACAERGCGAHIRQAS